MTDQQDKSFDLVLWCYGIIISPLLHRDPSCLPFVEMFDLASWNTYLYSSKERAYYPECGNHPQMAVPVYLKSNPTIDDSVK